MNIEIDVEQRSLSFGNGTSRNNIVNENINTNADYAQRPRNSASKPKNQMMNAPSNLSMHNMFACLFEDIADDEQEDRRLLFQVDIPLALRIMRKLLSLQRETCSSTNQEDHKKLKHLCPAV